MSRVDVDLYLRTPQIDYLTRRARRDETTLSRVFSDIIATHAETEATPQKPTAKGRKHVLIASHHFEALERYARRHGLSLSDAARRLTDVARKGEPVSHI